MCSLEIFRFAFSEYISFNLHLLGVIVFILVHMFPSFIH